ncbi:MAG: hypothetical protein A2Z24_00850 [Candidatus Woykebacteria bacterium RBG_16_44_10]|uniref:LamG-like jellyroll fold domain-containing protein n=1 Tax=Candidatus Woykebacteria bacterium RBG_16_44_10 TaxID=1802597 RepID=A0A1G1WFR4_9BACT|nr:MAG: hypothetical protein A2Z24_00850 [Candidatus Woykebacteria bacterium RBG_16_44_10]
MPGVLPDGSDDQYAVASGATLTDATIFAVFNQTANAGAKVVVGGALNGSLWFGTDFDERGYLGVAAVSTIAKTTSVAPVGSAMLLTGQYTSAGSSAILRVNRVDDTGTVTAQTISTANDTVIARGASSNTFNGTIYEIVFYNRLLSTAEIALVENYLKAKWNTP